MENRNGLGENRNSKEECNEVS
uniref:Uncharacterized protein n=1 Tax=Arundo donax TaxID=35708 RepID=A0A0A9ARX9_ARUDO